MSKLTIEVTESNRFNILSTLSDFLEEHKSSFSEDNVRNLYRNLFPCVAKLASKQIALFIT
jgi:hypothetical protein